MVKFRYQVVLYVLSAIIVAFDQYTKGLVREGLGLYERYIPFAFLEDIFDIIHTHNSGAAFGMFQQGGAFFTAIAFVVVGAIMIYNAVLEPHEQMVRVALGLQMGGAIGNLIDRLQRGYVTDFLYFHGFPVFNIADLAITMGVVVLIMVMIVEAREIAAREAATAEADASVETPAEN